MKIILLGAPGSGKGTVAENLSKEFNIPQISTGEIFRANIENKTSLGIKIDKFMKSGNLVPDEIVLEVVRQRICESDCENGYILDGFPRTIQQAKLFDKIAQVDYIFNIDVPMDEVIKRLLLRKRSDDKIGVIQERLKVYNKQGQQLNKYYINQIITINGNQSREEVYNQIENYIKKGSKKS